MRKGNLRFGALVLCPDILTRRDSLYIWIKPCEAMSVDPTSSEGYIVLDKLNYYEETVEKKGGAFWWLLPVEVMCNFEMALSRLMQLEVTHDLVQMVQELTEKYYILPYKL